MSIKLNRKGAGLAGEDRVKENQNLEMIEQEFGRLGVAKEDSAAAKLSALEALAKADAADSLSRNVQTQLNTIVVSGDSSPQAEQASVGARGEDYGGNLKARLDAEFNETAALLADKAEASMLPIYLLDEGVSVSNTAEVNTQIINQTFTVAGLSGRPVVFPWTGTEYIKVNGRLTAHYPFQILGFGRQTKIKQYAEDKTFDLRADRTHISDLLIEGAAGKEHGVYITSNFSSARGITLINLIDGVRVSSKDSVTGAKKPAVQGVVVDNIESQDVNFTFVVEGSRDLVFWNIRGSYRIKSPKNPHLIYFSDGDGTDQGPLSLNYNVSGGNCSAFDGEQSFPYQFKFMKGGRVSGLAARNCFGLLNIMDSDDFIASDLSGLDDVNTEKLYGSIDIDGTNTNIDVKNFNLSLKNNAKAIRIGDNTVNSRIAHGRVKTAYTNTDVDLVTEIRGTDNVLDDIEVQNTGTAQANASIGIWSGLRNTIRRPKTAGNGSGVRVRQGNDHKVEDYNIVDLKHTPTSPSQRPLDIVSTAGRILLTPKTHKSSGIGEQNRLLAFDRGDVPSASTSVIYQTTSGHPWVWAHGTWNSNGQRVHSTIASNSVAYIKLDTANLELSAGIKVKNREALVVRVIDRHNWIGVKLNQLTNSVQICKRVDAAETVLMEHVTPITVGRRYAVTLQVFGNQLEVYFEGIKIMAYLISAGDMVLFGAVKNHGLYANGEVDGKFDNIEWRDIE